jgi:hypothetical protein
MAKNTDLPNPTATALSIANDAPAKPQFAALPRDPNAAKPAQFIIIIRAQKGTLHAALDEKRSGPGALMIYTSHALAQAAAQANEICKTLKYYILPIA